MNDSPIMHPIVKASSSDIAVVKPKIMILVNNNVLLARRVVLFSQNGEAFAKLSKPRVIGLNPLPGGGVGVRFTPFGQPFINMTNANLEEANINCDHVIAFGDPPDDIAKAYLQDTSGIIPPGGPSPKLQF